MNTSTHRPIPIALTMVIALFSALAALAVSGGHDAAAHGSPEHAATATISQKELALRQDMRKLWEDHVTWTRLAVISLTTDAPDAQASVGRLLENQKHNRQRDPALLRGGRGQAADRTSAGAHSHRRGLDRRRQEGRPGGHRL